MTPQQCLLAQPQSASSDEVETYLFSEKETLTKTHVKTRDEQSHLGQAETRQDSDIIQMLETWLVAWHSGITAVFGWLSPCPALDL